MTRRHTNWKLGPKPNSFLRPCPHDTFPNCSRPVALVHTGATGTLFPVSRDYLATWNEPARSIAIGRALSTLSCGRSPGRYGPVSKSADTFLNDFFPLRFHMYSIYYSNMTLWSKADTRTLIRIWGEASRGRT